jgi:hypothetical protein
VAGSYLLYFPIVFGVLEIQRKLHAA